MDGMTSTEIQKLSVSFLKKIQQPPLKTPTKNTILLQETPDIITGAILLSHMKIKCENCGVMETPQWRKGWYNSILNRYVSLCNACGLKYNKRQCCSFCNFIYDHIELAIEGKWKRCRVCGRAAHTSCLKKYGHKKNVCAYCEK